MTADALDQSTVRSTDGWTFVHIADVQVGSPRSFRFAPAWNDNWETAKAQILDINPRFVLVGGDLTRDGYIHRFELSQMKKELDSLPFPCHVIPGNMDIGNKCTKVNGAKQGRFDVNLNVKAEALRQYRDLFGELWWTVEYGELRASGFCDILMGSGLPEEGQMWDWLEDQAARPPAKHNIWVVHYALFMDSPEEPQPDHTRIEQYHDWYFTVDRPNRLRLLDILKRGHADLVISGHIHCRRSTRWGNIRFQYAPATCFPQMEDRWSDGDGSLGFLRYDLSGAELRSTFVPLKSISTREGYGPGGHPEPEERDYSIAWERPQQGRK